MKKLITLVAVTLMATASMAQHEVGTKVGYNYLMSKYDGIETEVETNGGGYHSLTHRNCELNHSTLKSDRAVVGDRFYL